MENLPKGQVLRNLPQPKKLLVISFSSNTIESLTNPFNSKLRHVFLGFLRSPSFSFLLQSPEISPEVVVEEYN